MRNYPERYIAYLAYFHGPRDYFECHEVMEEHWKEYPDSEYRSIWHGLIQVAVSLYHQRRGNVNGALKMMESAIGNLKNEPLHELGLDTLQLLNVLGERLEEIKERGAYTPLYIPLADGELAELIKKLTGGGDRRFAPRDEQAPAIRDKHLVRDRSSVIAQRQAAWEQRRLRERHDT